MRPIATFKEVVSTVVLKWACISIHNHTHTTTMIKISDEWTAKGTRKAKKRNNRRATQQCLLEVDSAMGGTGCEVHRGCAGVHMYLPFTSPAPAAEKGWSSGDGDGGGGGCGGVCGMLQTSGP